MWLCLFCILTIGSVQSLTIGYPLRTLLAYDSIGSQNPEKTTAAQGFLIYLDNSGIERIVGYNYAEPVCAIHKISYINREVPMSQTFAKAESTEVIKAQEAHFRAWSLQQYQVLKREIDFLREEGKEPSTEMLLKFLPLEKIALTSDYSKISELPEVKRIREEHLNIWQQVPHWDEDQIKVNIKSYIEKPNTTLVDIEATLEQKLTNENNLNTFNKQIAELELQHQFAQNANTKANILQSFNEDKSVIYQLNSTEAGDDLKNIKSEARFANKIRSESLNSESLNSEESNVQKKLPSNEEKQIPTVSSFEKENLKMTTENSKKLEIFQETDKNELAELHLKPTNQRTVVRVHPLQVSYTPEVVKERKEHLSLVIKAKQKINDKKKMQSELEKLISAAPKIYVPQQVVDTAEVIRARDEHLRIVKEAIQKAKLAQGVEKQELC